MNECEYCRAGNKSKIKGKSFKVQHLVSDRFENVFVLQGFEDEKAGLMLCNYSYIDINYCPMCGRKLGDE